MENHAKYKNFGNALRCPLCEESLQVVQSKSLICPNRHTFDISHHGYVNMLSHSPKSRYNKALFEARKNIIMESDLFKLLHEKISAVIDTYYADSDTPAFILDAGCGEGSHLEKILGNSRNRTLTGIGLDLSKAGIAQAAKRYKQSIWLVGDLAKSPLADHSMNMIVNIFSPSNYKEFKRILAPDGLIIKVVPRAAHLKELRNAISKEKSLYKNDETISLFKKHFTLTDIITVSDTRVLDKSERTHLVQMSPLAWDSNETTLGAFTTRSCQITIDADILIGLNKKETRF